MKIRKNKISILGCGWLGFPLAKQLISKGFLVKGSTTSVEKMPVLEANEINPFLISIKEQEINGNIEDFLANSSILIVDIPPKLRGNDAESFVAKMEKLIPFVEKSSIEKIVFISSTSVYADDNSTVTEETIPQPDTESGRQLLEVEKLWQNNPNFKTTILRFSGLIGDDRHPINHIAGKENLENPEGPINLIHQKDCIDIMERIIQLDCWNETLNAAFPFHPKRCEYYTKKATELHLSLPKFVKNKPSVGKVILSEKIEKLLQYQFKNAI